MGTLLEILGVFFPVGCGVQQAMGGVFSRDLSDEEETHRCILNFQTMREMFTHDELELVMLQLGWKALTKRGGWRRYFKGADASSPHGLATVAKLPARSFVDAPKHTILDFVKTVNRRENRNVLCCWEHRGQLLMLGWDRGVLK